MSSNRRRSASAPKILDVLKAYGDLTSREIADLTGIPLSTVDHNMNAMLEAKLIHIARLNNTPKRKGRPAAVYRLGPGTRTAAARGQERVRRRQQYLEKRRKLGNHERIKRKVKGRSTTEHINPFAAMAMQLGA